MTVLGLTQQVIFVNPDQRDVMSPNRRSAFQAPEITAFEEPDGTGSVMKSQLHLTGLSAKWPRSISPSSVLCGQADTIKLCKG